MTLGCLGQYRPTSGFAFYRGINDRRRAPGLVSLLDLLEIGSGRTEGDQVCRSVRPLNTRGDRRQNEVSILGAAWAFGRQRIVRQGFEAQSGNGVHSVGE